MAILYSLTGLLAVLGLPLFVVCLACTALAFWAQDTPIASIPIAIYQVAEQPTLMAIPFFTFAGHILAKANTPKRMLDVAHALLGKVPGGLSLVVLLLCAFFTAFTGASGVTIIALGGLLFPILKNQGYDEKFSLGLITTCGSLGLLFAPSLPIILYGLVAQVDIEKIFLAGLVPGFFLIFLLFGFCLWEQLRGAKGAKTLKKVEAHGPTVPLRQALKDGFLELLLPVGVLVGIYGGFVTAPEASILSAFYVLVIECFYYKDIHWRRDVPAIITESQVLVGAILLILCAAMGLTDYLVEEEVPMKILALIQQYVESPYSFLVLLNLFLLGVGAVMDIFSAIIVVVPLILPVASQFGIDPVHLAIIFLTNLEIGYITPPVGINLFISSLHFKKPLTHVYMATFRFLFLMLFGLLVITYVPSFSLWFK